MAKKVKKRMSRETFAKGALRRASLMWPEISECRRLARRDRNQYECAICHELFPSKQTQVDHREPIVDIMKGFTTWDEYIERLFCDIDKLDLLCINCHDAKTTMEVQLRKYARAKRKEMEGSVEDEEV